MSLTHAAQPGSARTPGPLAAAPGEPAGQARIVELPAPAAGRGRLGVGIDYALFVVTRYRAGLRAGSAPAEAVVAAMTTSGRVVVFAGSTVVLSLLGLFLLGLPFIYGATLGAIIAVLLVMAASVTLLGSSSCCPCCC
jgi:MMPL family protein